MIGIEFLVSLFITAIIVYFIRKKIAARKKINDKNIPLRQKDIKRNKKKELKEQKKQNNKELN